jgi:NhaP-type Na+/H+ or K+/H+ antiporter
MLAAAVVAGLATACQVVAPRLRIPSLVLLLPAGFALGLLAPQIRLDLILGPAFPAAVDLIVAVILFQGGLELTGNPLTGKDHGVVRRLVWVGGAVTLVCGALLAHALIGLEWSMAFMLGALVIVSGPTVVTPILDFARLRGRVRGILQWEGTLLDPIGALVAVVVLQVIKASGAETAGEATSLFFGGIAVGIASAIIGVALFVIGGRLVGTNSLLGTQVLLGSVIVAAGLANFVSQDSGLIAALIMGTTAPRVARHFGASLESSRPFFNTVVSIGIGVLFISIAGLVPSAMTMAIVLPAIVMALVLMLVVRPIVVAIGTMGTDLSRKERTFIACMDPRGIVAVATASGVGPALIALKAPGADQLLPAAFIIVAVTVAVYGLAAVPISRMLGLSEPDPAPVVNASS